LPAQKADFVPRLRPGQLPDRAARWLPRLPTTTWVDPPSTGDLRRWGALLTAGGKEHLIEYIIIKLLLFALSLYGLYQFAEQHFHFHKALSPPTTAPLVAPSPQQQKRKPKDEVLRCSFCHKSQDQVKKLIGNPQNLQTVYTSATSALPFATPYWKTTKQKSRLTKLPGLL
jgi:hypothetical protein